MRFAQKISELEHRFPQKGQLKNSAQNWKEVQIVVHQKNAQEVVFEVTDEGSDQLTESGLKPTAFKVAKETIDVLNRKAKEVRIPAGESLSEEIVVKNLSSLRVEENPIEHLAGWVGTISREQAERLLENQLEGSYVIREGDALTESAAFHLGKTNSSLIRPYLLTVVESEEKISDILILHTDKGWTFYKDDPDLKNRAYHFHRSPDFLIQSLSPLLKYPITR
jgi:hypothetical protein